MGSQLHYPEASLHTLCQASHGLCLNVMVHVSQQQSWQQATQTFWPTQMAQSPGINLAGGSRPMKAEGLKTKIMVCTESLTHSTVNGLPSSLMSTSPQIQWTCCRRLRQGLAVLTGMQSRTAFGCQDYCGSAAQGPYAPQGSRKLQKWSRRSKSVLPWF